MVDELAQLSGKTRDLSAVMERNGWRSVLFVSGPSVPEPLARAAFNNPKVCVVHWKRASNESFYGPSRPFIDCYIARRFFFLSISCDVCVQVDVLPQQGINVYDILRREHLCLSVDSLPYIQDELLKHV